MTSIPRLVANDHPPRPHVAVRSVVEAGHRGDADVIHKALTDDLPAVRAAALSASLRLGALDWPLLERFLVDPAPTVRRRAAELSTRIGDPHNPVGALIDLLDDEPMVAEMGAFALGELGQDGPEVVEALETAVRDHPDALCRESAVAALGALHQGRQAILAALSDKATVRRRAILALAPFEGPDIDAALRAALQDRDWQVRQAAEDLLQP